MNKPDPTYGFIRAALSSIALPIAFAIALISFFYMIFFYIPLERQQGIIQKIFYFHVPSAILMMIGYFIGFVFSILYLIRREVSQYATALSAIEVAFLFNTIVLLSGPFWAKPVWDVWWTWDPRLTSTLILWLTYMAYLYIGSNITADRQPKIGASIIGTVAFVNIPIVHYSVTLWRGIHPQVISDPGALPLSMKLGLQLGVVTLGLLFIILWQMKRRLLLQKFIVNNLEIALKMSVAREGKQS